MGVLGIFCDRLHPEAPRFRARTQHVESVQKATDACMIREMVRFECDKKGARTCSCFTIGHLERLRAPPWHWFQPRESHSRHLPAAIASTKSQSRIKFSFNMKCLNAILTEWNGPRRILLAMAYPGRPLGDYSLPHQRTVLAPLRRATDLENVCLPGRFGSPVSGSSGAVLTPKRKRNGGGIIRAIKV
jgi:hypothetical protein